MFLPDGHKVEDIGHSRAVAKQITQAELEDYGGHQDSVPAHKNIKSPSRILLQSLIRPKLPLWQNTWEISQINVANLCFVFRNCKISV